MSMMDGLELVHSFIVVAEELNFRRSAERLHLDQSALSRRIQKLEQFLGFSLLERTTREVSLTPAGRTFYSDNKSLLGNYARSVEVAQAVAKGHSGVLTVAYMAFAAVELMPRAVVQYRRLRPHVALNLKYVRTQGQKLLLANGEIDVGYMLGPLDHGDFKSVKLLSDPLCVIATQNHPINRLRSVRPEDVGEYPLVLGDMAEWEFYRWRLEDLFGQNGVSLTVAFQASNTLALMGLVRAGLGITILPESIVPALHAGLEARPIEKSGFTIDTLIAWRKSNNSLLIHDFIDAATNLATRY
jgi:LysR family transcriptional regulator, benzoate and cis,cis-muconate-responsive activator of ben and cat genes